MAAFVAYIDKYQQKQQQRHHSLYCPLQLMVLMELPDVVTTRETTSGMSSMEEGLDGQLWCCVARMVQETLGYLPRPRAAHQDTS